jgi:hypothetical protein
MLQQLDYAKAVLSINADRLRQNREDERGMTTETVIIIGIMAAVAVAVGGILAVAIRNKGNEAGDNIQSADLSGGN